VVEHDSHATDAVFLAELATVMRSSGVLPEADNADIAKVFYATGARYELFFEMRFFLIFE
jgi:hypothetical protein